MLPEKDIRVYKISELINELNDFLKLEYSKVYVKGEISKIQTYSSGHTYLTLKDEEGAVLNGVIFSYYAKSKKKELEELKEGDNILVFGTLNIYAPRGDIQIKIFQFEQLLGEGVWLKRFNEIKKRLDEKGYTDIQYKKPLPETIKSVGIITSVDGAAIKDILSVYRKRKSDVHIFIYPSLVQGKTAPENLIRGIRFFNKNYKDKIDLIILTRGGGSIEDLWCFNDEKLAEEIFKSELLIVSAVGHERDFTISDYVADKRVATPTAAGELVFQDNSEKINNLFNKMLKNYRIILDSLFKNGESIKNYKIKFSRFQDKIFTLTQLIDQKSGELSHKIEMKMEKNIQSFIRKRVSSFEKTLFLK